MKIDILTLFPDLVKSVLKESIIGRAIQEEKITINVINFRDYAHNKHKKVDDYPYGGGAGMLLSVQPIYDALSSIGLTEEAKVLYMSPQGKTFNQKKAYELAKCDHLVIICGHYEGVDQRVIDHLIDEEVSIGDYVLTGGELASLVVVDAVARLRPDVLSDVLSHKEDSFAMGLLEYPQYTRPRDFNGWVVPDVLFSGHHQWIEDYKLKESLRNTYLKRPDLLESVELTEKQKQFLKEVIEEENKSQK